MRSSHVIIIVASLIIPSPRSLVRGFAGLVPARRVEREKRLLLGVVVGIIRAPLDSNIPPRNANNERIIIRPKNGIVIRGYVSPLYDIVPGGGDDGFDDDGDGGGGGGGGGRGFDVEAEPLNRIFQRAVVLQRMGDRSGCLREYEKFLNVAKMHDVDPTLYAEVHANIGAIYAMRAGRKDHQPDDGAAVAAMDYHDYVEKEEEEEEILDRAELRTRAKESFGMAVRYRPDLGSAWVNLALVVLSEGKELGGKNDDGIADDDGEQQQSMHVKKCLTEARQCCERALGMDNDDERSRALAMRLIGDIDSMMRQLKK